MVREYDLGVGRLPMEGDFYVPSSPTLPPPNYKELVAAGGTGFKTFYA